MESVIIIGKGVGWELAPLDGESWGVNDLCTRRDVKLVFAMDNLDENKEIQAVKDIVEYVKKTNVPFVGSKEYEYLPTSIRFPIEKMHTDYFTNSIAFMIAYAIYIGVKHIDMYGCVLWGGSEYSYQKPNIEYWIGYARGLGIDVGIHGNTNLMKSHDGKIYGYNKQQERN